MASKRTSAQITERYRSRVLAIRQRAQREAESAWRRVDHRDLDGTWQPGLLALMVEAMQREAARASGAYLQTYLESELRMQLPQTVVDATMVGQARNGDSLRRQLDSPMLGVKHAIKQGASAPVALAAGLPALTRVVGLATDTAARTALTRAMAASPHVDGWRRAVKGTCGACIGAARQRPWPVGTPMGIHPNCQCVSEPCARWRRAEDVLRGRWDNLTAADRQAVGNFSGVPGLAQDMNAFCRGSATRVTDLSDAELVKQINALDTALKHSGQVGEHVKLWRGLKGSDFDEVVRSQLNPALEQAFTDNGFGVLVGNPPDETEENNPDIEPIEGQWTAIMELTLSTQMNAIFNVDYEEFIIARYTRHLSHRIEELIGWRLIGSLFPGPFARLFVHSIPTAAEGAPGAAE